MYKNRKSPILGNILTMTEMKMRVIFYMPVVYGSVADRIKWVKENKFRGELIYNIIDTEKLGCDVIPSPTKLYSIADKRLYVYNTWQFLRLAGQYDVIYSPYYQGLEWLVYMRAIGLFRKKIVVWHHSPIEKPKKLLAKWKQKLFFHGCDALLFFTDKIKQLSVNKGCPTGKMHVVDWGPDMAYFDMIRPPKYTECKGNYLMSGSDSRDFDSAMEAFVSLPNVEFDVCPPSDELYQKYRNTSENTHLFQFEKNNKGYEKIAQKTAGCKAVIIITKPIPGRKLPSGLTSICEAVALGKPCIITDNPYFSDEMRNAGFALFVKVGDVEGIRMAIKMLEENPVLRLKMSEAALAYARMHSSENTAKQLVEIFKGVMRK